MVEFKVTYQFDVSEKDGASGHVTTYQEADSLELLCQSVTENLARPSFVTTGSSKATVIIQTAHVRFVEIRPKNPTESVAGSYRQA